MEIGDIAGATSLYMTALLIMVPLQFLYMSLKQDVSTECFKVERESLIKNLALYKEAVEIQDALNILAEVDSAIVSNTDVEKVWHRLSITLEYLDSDDENHPLLYLEAELYQAYKRT